MAEDPQPLTLQQRIAALNQAHIGRIPGEPPLPITRPKPQLPQRPAVPRQQTVNIPPEQVNGTVTDIKVGNQPSGPPALPNRKQPPPLPNRKSSEESSRRTSIASVSSTGTNETNGSRVLATRTKSEDPGPRIKAPAWGECDLPALPPKRASITTRPNIPERPKYSSRTSQQSIASVRSFSSQNSSIKAIEAPPVPPIPAIPPLPARKVSVDHQNAIPEQPVRKLPPVPSVASLEQAKKAAFNIAEEEPLTLPNTTQQPAPTKQAITQPPPVPHASRPDLAALQATKPKLPVPHVANGYIQQPTPRTDECMTCRDFSGPDNHAARFPRQQVSSLQDLAYHLTSPFPSLTDKARAIFTWLHYNISYDVVSFFGGNVKGSTPQSTLQSGLAVCEGYAALFANLATYAGLEAIVVSGHGKGFGHNNLKAGEPLPPYDGNHAWNAVKIDNGEWKLIDPCWGAGHVQGAGMPYIQEFHPQQFTMSNEKFGTKHFPSNKDQFFLPGGRRLSWEEYIQINPDSWPYHCEPPTIFTNAKTDHGIGEETVLPRDRKIRVKQQNVIRFQFGLICPHWTLDKHTKKGLPPLFLLGVHGIDGRNEDLVPLEYVKGTAPGGGGDLWYVDVSAKELGAPGQTLTLFAVTSFGNRQNVRGLTVQEFCQGKGRVGMGFVGIAAWDLV